MLIVESIGAVVTVLVSAVLILLVRSLTRLFERVLETNGNKHADPEEISAILEDAINTAVKKSEDRNRKRTTKERLEDLTDSELESLLDGKVE